jgi:hypothetical protein
MKTQRRTSTTTDLDLPELAGRINAEHAAVSAAMRQGLEHARRAGELLCEARQHVPHGDWEGWLAEHFHGSARTARLYMRVFRRWLELPAAHENGNALPLREAARLLATPRVVDPLAVLDRINMTLREVLDTGAIEAVSDLSEIDAIVETSERLQNELAESKLRCMREAARLGRAAELGLEDTDARGEAA